MGSNDAKHVIFICGILDRLRKVSSAGPIGRGPKRGKPGLTGSYWGNLAALYLEARKARFHRPVCILYKSFRSEYRTGALQRCTATPRGRAQIVR